MLCGVVFVICYSGVYVFALFVVYRVGVYINLSGRFVLSNDVSFLSLGVSCCVVMWVACTFRHVCVGIEVGYAPTYNSECGVLCYL